MAAGCQQESCTVVETGKCLLNNDPVSCPQRLAEAASEPVIADEPPLEKPKERPRFPPSLALNPEAAGQMAAGRYVKLVGILGAPNAGKTASLVSLYLLLAGGKLRGFRFRDSRSLMALDEISRGARRWNEGQLPDQMTTHTEQPSDERTAGFMHLRLADDASGDLVDLLLPDIPGEWSDTLINSARTDRLEFLRSADVIWIMVDGRQLFELATRQLAIHRTKMLLQRVADFLKSPPPVILVVSRRDQSQIDTRVTDALVGEATARGLELEVVSIASFADEGKVKPGEGIADLISLTTKSRTSTSPFWSDAEPSWQGRGIENYRRGGSVP